MILIGVQQDYLRRDERRHSSGRIERLVAIIAAMFDEAFHSPRPHDSMFGSIRRTARHRACQLETVLNTGALLPAPSADFSRMLTMMVW